MARIEWDLSGVKNLQQALATGNTADFRQMLTDVGNMYLQFLERRYRRASRSPGNPWKELSESTIRQRKEGSGEGSPAILVDKGALADALKPGAPGNLMQVSGRKVRIGYSQTAHRGGITFADLADIHQAGNSRLPARPIFVEPDEATKRRLQNVIKRGIQRIGEKAYGRR